MARNIDARGNPREATDAAQVFADTMDQQRQRNNIRREQEAKTYRDSELVKILNNQNMSKSEKRQAILRIQSISDHKFSDIQKREVSDLYKTQTKPTAPSASKLLSERAQWENYKLQAPEDSKLGANADRRMAQIDAELAKLSRETATAPSGVATAPVGVAAAPTEYQYPTGSSSPYTPRPTLGEAATEFESRPFLPEGQQPPTEADYIRGGAIPIPEAAKQPGKAGAASSRIKDTLRKLKQTSTITRKPLGSLEDLQPKKLDPNNPDDIIIAQRFLEQAGGDKKKARKLAKEAGYTFDE